MEQAVQCYIRIHSSHAYATSGQFAYTSQSQALTTLHVQSLNPYPPYPLSLP